MVRVPRVLNRNKSGSPLAYLEFELLGLFIHFSLKKCIYDCEGGVDVYPKINHLELFQVNIQSKLAVPELVKTLKVPREVKGNACSVITVSNY